MSDRGKTENRDLPRSSDLQPLAVGLLSAVIGFAAAVAVVLQGYAAAGASTAAAASALLALCVVKGMLGVWLSVRTRMPITIAWSTPSAALLVAVGAPAQGWPETVGAFLIAAALIVFAGLFKPFAQLIARIPTSLAAAMLAGVLFELCLAPVRAVEADPMLAAPVVIVWALALRFARLYAVPLAALAATVIIAGSVDLPAGAFADLSPQAAFVTPVFTMDAAIGLAAPLFIVTMASQNIPGLAVLNANGYRADPAPIFVSTGLASGVIGLFGGHQINLAAITAALCAGPEAHPDPARRWLASAAAGTGYLLFGLTATAVTAFVAAAPQLLIQAVAGLALLSSLAGALATSLRSEEQQAPAVLTFVIAASGVTFLGVGAAFWALVTGGALLIILSIGRKASARTDAGTAR